MNAKCIESFSRPSLSRTELLSEARSQDYFHIYQNTVLHLTTEELNQLEEAHRQGYLLTTGRDQRLSSVWRAKCAASGQSFIRIQCEGHLSTLFCELPLHSKNFPHNIQHALIWIRDQVSHDNMLVGEDYVFCSEWRNEDIEHLVVILLGLT